MNILRLILRLIHVFAGVFWVGGALMTYFYITPSVAATAEAGQKFMGHMVNQMRLTVSMTLAGILTILAGSWLYWIDSAGLTSAWQHSGPGIGFGIGALTALIGFGFGLLVGKNATLIGKLAAQAASQPRSDFAGQILAARNRMKMAGQVSTVALVVALICMATARYWLF